MKTVLLVEDDLLDSRIFSKIFRLRSNLTVEHVAGDVEAVLQMAQSGEVGVILMDVSLHRSFYQGKRIDGIQVTQMLKQNPRTASIPVLLMTRFTMPEHREMFLRQSGADGFIPKPVMNHQAFVDEITALLPPS
jgi:two-component system cell cycle response regulator DivK